MHSKFLNWIFPPRCLSCKIFTDGGIDSEESLCSACGESWPSLDPAHCVTCALPFFSPETGMHRCGHCLVEEKQCRRVYAAGIYEGILLNLIVRLKYKKEERLAGFLAKKMANALPKNDFDLLVPVPLHKTKLQERGFNQAVLMARTISKKLRLPVNPFVLEKKRPTPAQAELKGEERRKNLKDVFALRDSKKVQGRKILLIDDVYTTGATIESASKALLQAGAKEVEALVLARAV